MELNKMTLNVTTNFEVFTNINCPMRKDNLTWISCNLLIPTNIEFNKTYYHYNNNNLLAFRILAMSIREVNDECGLFYLVQIPNNKPTWIPNFLNAKSILFSSTEHYLSYVAQQSKRLDLGFNPFYKAFTHLSSSKYVFELKSTYVWDDYYKKPIARKTYMYYVLITENGITIGTDHYNENGQGYANLDDCIKSHLNNMQIIDFNDECEITIHVQQNTTPKVHVLKFVEE